MEFAPDVGEAEALWSRRRADPGYARTVAAGIARGVGVRLVFGRWKFVTFICRSRDPAYLDELAAALTDNGIELFSLLVDAGDMTDPDHAERDLAWIAGWFEDAARLGAARARVSGGNSAPSETSLAASVAGMRFLVDQAEANGLRLMTENWQKTLSTPDAVLHVLDRLDGRVGLCVDFNNWSGASKYADLEAIMPRAESCHVKLDIVADGGPDVTDLRYGLAITREAGFTGPYTLIYDGRNSQEWNGIRTLWRLVEMG